MLLNMENGEWSYLPKMATNIRYDFHAGLVNYPDDTQAIIVYGGNGFPSIVHAVEMFHLSNMTWTAGPTPPYSISSYYNHALQLNDTFVVVGVNANQGNGNKRDMLIFDPLTNDWALWDRILPFNNFAESSILIPDGIINCQ